MKSIIITIFLGSLFLSGCQNNVQPSDHNHTSANDDHTACNMPKREELTSKPTNQNEAPPLQRVKNQKSEPPENMVLIQGGNFKMGSDKGMEYEQPVHEVKVDSFWIDRHEVTVAEFEKFVSQTKYLTEAEKFGWSGVFDIKAGEWTRGDKVTWRNPDGDGKKPNPNEPVTQISWNDAVAFAKWAGKRLPTEAEWEFASRGGLEQNEFVWGNQLRPNGKPVANWWQGTFPDKNTAEDGFIKRAPVMSFPPNGYGLYDMAGNVWEWTQDWFASDYYKWSSSDNPTGAVKSEEKSIRGGSWMCAENFCTNYRTAARSHSTPDTGLNNLGFRLVMDE